MKCTLAILVVAAALGLALAGQGDGGEAKQTKAGGHIEAGSAGRDRFNQGKSASQIAKEQQHDAAEVFARQLNKDIKTDEFQFESDERKGSGNKLTFKLKTDDGVTLRLHVSIVNATAATSQHIDEEMGVHFLEVFKYTPATAGDVWTNGTARTTIVDLREATFNPLSCADTFVGDATSNATVTTCSLSSADGTFTIITELANGIFYKTFGNVVMKVAPTSLKVTLNLTASVGSNEQIGLIARTEAERDSDEKDSVNTDGAVSNQLAFGTVSIFTWETTAINPAGTTLDVKSATGPQSRSGDSHDRSIVFCFPAGEGAITWDPSLDAGQSFTGLAASSASTLVASLSALLALLSLALFA